MESKHTETQYTDLRGRLESIGQGHVLRFWNELSPMERSELLKDISTLDFHLLKKLAGYVHHPPSVESGELAPPVVLLASDSHARARAHGEKLVTNGKVAFVLVAGGQATRLGFDQPKGCFPIGPLSRRSLFQFHADRIRAITKKTGKAPLWFIMTSPANHETTVEFFVKNNYFALPPESIQFFPQSTVPAFDRLGKLVLESKSRLFRNPNGHGGSLWALSESGFLKRCREQGVEHLYYWQVDNPLARLADPLFMGLHDLDRDAGMSSKVVAKRGPGEKVGILARRGGATHCVEYSDLPATQRDARGADGELLYGAGNIAIHAFRVDFVDSLTKGELQLPWHRAEKKIRSIDAAGNTTEVPGIKFETFVFDALPLSKSTVTLEVKREDEFAPVKNAEGEDSPATSRAAIDFYYKRWVRKAGIEIVNSEKIELEIHPMFALDFAEFQQKKHRLPSPLKSSLFVPEHP